MGFECNNCFSGVGNRCDVPFQIDRPMLLGTVAICPVMPKKQATPRTTMNGFGSFWKTHTVDCAWFQDHISISMILRLCRYYKLLLMHPERISSTFSCINQHELPFERLSGYPVSNTKKPFSNAIVHWYLSYLCLRMPLSQDMSHDDQVLSVHAEHWCCLAQQPMLDDLQEVRSGVSSLCQFSTGIRYTSFRRHFIII